MAELRFFYGTMGSGKSTMALLIHHNLILAGQRGLLVTRQERRDGAVASRLGVSRPAVELAPDDDIRQRCRSARSGGTPLQFLVCDEAQFYAVEQIEQLAELVDDEDLDVYAFGLLTDFRGRLFPATARLLELADHLEVVRSEARCWCGRPATHHARVVAGAQVRDGDTIVPGDLGPGDEVTYELRCRRHWRQPERR